MRLTGAESRSKPLPPRSWKAAPRSCSFVTRATGAVRSSNPRARIAALCREAGATFVVNDRADFAMLLGAGLHVGQDDLPPRDARNLIGGEALLGFSSHNPSSFARRAASRWITSR